MYPLRLVRVALLAMLALVVLAACTAASPGWTYQPAPSPTAQPSVESAAPSGGGSAAPSGEASAEPSASGGSDGGEIVKISAQGIAFEQAEVTVPAGVPFKIEFTNNDAGTPHNVAIHQGDAAGQEVFKGEIFNGVDTRTYDVPALDAGAYAFVCSVHPNMVGTMTAQ
jgi:plastocyanin